MNSKLDVTVAVDMGSGTITITPTGELTLRNVHGLLPVARRAASLAPDFLVTVDLSGLAAADPQALQLLANAGPREARILGPDFHGTVQTKPGRHARRGSRRTAPPPGAAA